MRWILLPILFVLSSCQMPGFRARGSENACAVEWIVLGVAQDAGIPQIGNTADAAWRDPGKRRLATSAALVDHRTGARFLFEATPDLREQWHRLETLAPSSEGALSLSGVFVTHAHIGHYAGLMFAGRESASTSGLPVYALPRMRAFLAENGPWSQLVTLNNIALKPLSADQATTLTAGITVTPMLVPHRDEYSETAAFLIRTPGQSVFFVPDIDAWDTWTLQTGHRIEAMADRADYLFVDATFFDDSELPGRDMRQIPHPRVPDTMARFKDAPADVRARVHFIHFNHTNPLRDSGSAAAARVRSEGFSTAREGQRLCLMP